MSKLIRALADMARMDLDEYVETHCPEIPAQPPFPYPNPDRPQKPASENQSQHERRCYAAMRSRSQVR